MASPILLTGGTGTLGQLIIPRLRESGSKVRVLSRSGDHPGPDGVEFVTGDLGTGAGLDTAMNGVGTVLHCAGSAKGDDEKARHLVRAARAAAVRHLVYISVVGADRIPVSSRLDRAMFGYFAAKRAAEQLVMGSGIAWTILRATQFHQLMRTLAEQLSRLPVVPAPAARVQPVDAGDVAARLVALALAEPAGLVPDLGGPRVYEMAALIRGYLRARGKRRLVVPVRLPGGAARAYRAGANLAPGGEAGTRTWEEFLAGS